MSETNDPDGQPPGEQPDYGQPGNDQTPGYSEQPGYGQGPGFGQTMPFIQLPQFGLPAPPGYGDIPGQLSAETSPILASFADPAKQSRVAVLFRGILAYPHFIVLYALGVAAGVVAIIGWFAALFTGQLPDFAHTFITQVTRWQTRVYAYYFMLTDRYPPFSLDDDNYPIRLVSRPTRLNRLAVLFRFILVIPASIVSAVAALGLGVLAFFIWLIALITGGLPTALHQAVAAVVRYQARHGGYSYLLTSEYPWGLYGDRLPAASADFVAPAAVVPDLSPGPDISAPPAALAEPMPMAEPMLAGGSLLAEPATAADDPWQLMLSSRAKALVTTFLLLGSCVVIGGVVALSLITGSTTVNNAVALAQIEVANSALNKNSQGFQSAVQACNGQLSCVTGLLHKESGYLQTFDSQLQGISLNGQPASDVATLLADDHVAEGDLNQLAAATSNAQYLNIASSSSLQQDLNKSSADYGQLVRDLGGH